MAVGAMVGEVRAEAVMEAEATETEEAETETEATASVEMEVEAAGNLAMEAAESAVPVGAWTAAGPLGAVGAEEARAQAHGAQAAGVARALERAAVVVEGGM